VKLVNPTEHAIYAAAFLRCYDNEDRRRGDRSMSDDEWAARCVDVAIVGAEMFVRMHRAGMQRRRG
jgi:hypothetical protein